MSKVEAISSSVRRVKSDMNSARQCKNVEKHLPFACCAFAVSCFGKREADAEVLLWEAWDHQCDCGSIVAFGRLPASGTKLAGRWWEVVGGEPSGDEGQFVQVNLVSLSLECMMMLCVLTL